MNLDERFSNTRLDETFENRRFSNLKEENNKTTKKCGARKIKISKKSAKNEAAIGATLKTLGSRIGTGAKNLGTKVANSSVAKNLGSKIKTGATNFGNDLKDVGKNTLSGVKNVGGAIKAHPIRTAAIGGLAGGAALGTYGAKKASRAAKKVYDNWNI